MYELKNKTAGRFPITIIIQNATTEHCLFSKLVHAVFKCSIVITGFETNQGRFPIIIITSLLVSQTHIQSFRT